MDSISTSYLIGVIQGLLLGRRIGPRASGWVLGLPSSTASLLVLCGWENGWRRRVEVSQWGLLGLVGAVALPLAYAQAVHFTAGGWRAPLAAAGATTTLRSASSLKYVHLDAVECLAIASGLTAGVYLAGRIRIPCVGSAGPRPGRWATDRAVSGRLCRPRRVACSAPARAGPAWSATVPQPVRGRPRRERTWRKGRPGPARSPGTPPGGESETF